MESPWWIRLYPILYFEDILFYKFVYLLLWRDGCQMDFINKSAVTLLQVTISYFYYIKSALSMLWLGGSAFGFLFFKIIKNVLVITVSS